MNTSTVGIVELEEGALSVTVAARRGRRHEATRSVHVPLPDLEPTTLVTILTSLSADLLRGVPEVHVVLGDRRMHHFRCEVPRLPPAELEELVRREAMRHTGLPNAADVLVAVSSMRTLPGRKLRIEATALPRAVWDGLRKVFAEAGVAVVSLRSLESCLALLAPTAAPTAVVECGVGRTRFVLCENRAVTQVRRFIVGSSASGSSEAIGAQLSIELPRTLEWLRESGNVAPASMLLGPRAAAGLRAIGMDTAGLPPIVERRDDVSAARGEGEPAVACSTLLDALSTGDVPGSLLDPVRIVLPMTGRRTVALAAATALAAAACWSAFDDARAWLRAWERHEQLRVGVAEIEAALREVQLAGEAASDATARMDAQLAHALGRRRPVSLLIHDLAKAARSVRLDAVDCAADDKVALSGFVTAASRREALEEVARFLREVRALPYLVAVSGEDIGEMPGLLHGFRFKVDLAWRSS